VTQLFEAGRAARVDRLRVEATLAQARAERAKSAAALDIAERTLARLIGGSVEETRASQLEDVSLDETVFPQRDSIEEEAMQLSPARRRSESELRAAKLGVPLAKSKRFPNLDLSAAIIDRGSDEGNFEAEWNAGLHLGLPLFTGGALKSAARRAEAQHIRAQESLRLREHSVMDEVDRALSRIEASKEQVRGFATAESRFEEVARVSQLLLESGSGTQIDYLEAEADLLTARGAYSKARYAEIAAHLELRRAVGDLDREWVERALRSGE
jgi:outer membrane protein